MYVLLCSVTFCVLCYVMLCYVMVSYVLFCMYVMCSLCMSRTGQAITEQNRQICVVYTLFKRVVYNVCVLLNVFCVIWYGWLCYVCYVLFWYVMFCSALLCDVCMCWHVMYMYVQTRQKQNIHNITNHIISHRTHLAKHTHYKQPF